MDITQLVVLSLRWHSLEQNLLKPIKNNLNAYICKNITNKAYKNGFRNPIKQFLLN